MGVDDGDVVLLFVANELHRKGFGQTLEAVARLHDRRVHIALVGRRPPTDYADVIQRLGLGEQVHYHGPTDDVGRWHAGADLLVLPTQYEPFGIVIVEALASGLPVVTTRLAGAAEAVEHGVTGWLQDDPYDVDELTALLRAALDADLVEAGRHAALGAQPYQWSQIFRRVERLVGL
jgi:UDP-glucose:(heptosyl)LPS alpha-1,3-glucosyltransferase